MNKLIKISLPVAAAAGALALSSSARADSSWGNFAGWTVGITVVVNPDGSLTVNTVGGPYDGSDDTLVTVKNNSSAVLNSLNLTSNSDIFGFDGDGIGSYTGNIGPDGYGYGSTDTTYTFSNVFSGTVNFLNGVSANGGEDYFSLEEPPSISGGTVITNGAPDGASTVALFGAAVLGLGALRRRFLKS